MTSLSDAAVKIAGYGVSFLPVADDKRPKRNPDGQCMNWAVYQTRVPSKTEAVGLMNGAFGVGVIGGTVSGNLETVDFEDYKAPVYEEWKSLVTAHNLGDVLAKCYVETSVRGGWHVLYRCESEVAGNQKLCTRIGVDENGQKKPLCVIETRGEGGYACVFPTPGYKCVQGSLGKLPVLTADQRDVLLALARSMDEAPTVAPNTVKIHHDPSRFGEPGSDFNVNADWGDLLSRDGWTIGRTLSNGCTEVVRPGKDARDCLSAKYGLGKGDGLYVFTTSVYGLEPGLYTKFGYWAYTRHGGDFSRAAKDLADQGYGDAKYKHAFDNRNGKIKHTEPEEDVPLIAGFRSYTQIVRGSVSWLWEPYIPLGGLSICVGDPGIGKSSFAFALAAAVSRGYGEGGFPKQEPGKVLLYCLEDDPEKIIRGRLEDNGADMENVIDGTYDAVECPQGIAPPMTLAKMQAIVSGAKTIPGVKLVVFDPVVEWFPAHRSMNTGNEARDILRLFRSLAEDCGCGVLVLGHPNKQTGNSLMYRVAGSIDFSAVARSGMYAAKLPDVEECALIHFKQNWGRKGSAIGYQIDDEGKFHFTGTSDVTEEMLAATETRQAPVTAKELDRCIAWLDEIIDEIGLPSKTVFSLGKDEGFSERTIKRAKAKRPSIKARPDGEVWKWRLVAGPRPYYMEDPFADD